MIGNRVWKDWDKDPFAVFLFTDENEFLIRHPVPSKDFTSLGYDSLLHSEIYFRKRTFSPDLLEAFTERTIRTIDYKKKEFRYQQ